MRKIRYNISQNKKVDYPRFFLFCSVIFIISAALITFGINNLVTSKNRHQNELKKLNSIEQESDKLSKKRKEYTNIINKAKSEWNSRAKLLNSLISKKTHSYIKKLNALEELLPAGVFISSISLSIESRSRIDFDVVAYSYENIVRAYKNFSKHELVIKGDTQSSELFSAKLKIKLKNEKD